MVALATIASAVTAVTKTRIAIVGLGKIASAQHIPALAGSEAFELAGVASPQGGLAGVPSYADLQALLQAVPDIAAVALCTPPQVRYENARLALERGLHVLLEKPPGVAVSEVQALAALAGQRGLALFASWHSRYAPAVEPARRWLETRRILAASVIWKEDVRVYHPGQAWVWQAGGLGVFDPGINALSVLTHIMPGTLSLREAQLHYPSNCEMPIAGNLLLSGANEAPIRLELDFNYLGPPCRQIDIQTDSGVLTLSKGGAGMRVNGVLAVEAPRLEYPELYRHFAQLVRNRTVDADVRPLQLTADAFCCATRVEVAPFLE